METTADQLKKYQQNETSAKPQDLRDLAIYIYKKHQWSYFLFIITFLLNILYFIIPTKTQSSPPPKKKENKNNTSHENSHICLARHQLFSRRGTQVWVASRRCLGATPKMVGKFPQQTHGVFPYFQNGSTFQGGEIGGKPTISGNTHNMQIGFRVLESICMIQPRLKTTYWS